MTLGGKAMNEKKLGERIRKERKKRGLAIRDLVPKVEISAAQITRIELGQRSCLDVNYLFKFSKALNIPFDELIQLALEDFYGEEFSMSIIKFPSIRNEDANKIEEIIRMLAEIDAEGVECIHKIAIAFLLAQKNKEL